VTERWSHDEIELLRELVESGYQIRISQRGAVRFTSKFSAGRNEPCPCGSRRKFKKCHGR
jgi:uncharacterized protein YecA (UPF0149 family)